MTPVFNKKIKFIACLLATLCAFNISGCVTSDVKVVNALRVGMSHSDAKAIMQTHGFEIVESLHCPVDGWSNELSAFAITGWRARREEERTGKRVVLVEHYLLGYGRLGAGELFLFYGEDDRLMNFYRIQIN